MNYGAAPADWSHFSLVLGLTPHLLPVVSNPHATISPASQLRTLGKVPSRYDAQGRVVGVAKWPKIQATHSQIDQWSKVGDYGICIQTREVRALDLDIEDLGTVNRVRGIIFDHLGALPVRLRPQSFRALLVFSVAGDLEKRSFQLPNQTGVVELLATGQQFIAAGTHPSGGRYFWDGGLPDDILEVTLERLDALWLALGGEVKPARVAVLPALHGEADDPVISWLFVAGWVLEGSRNEKLLITCPWACDHTSDSGPTETAYWPAATGGYEMGHFKCLHAHCAARTDADFLSAVGFARSFAGEFPDPSAVVVAPGLETSNLPAEAVKKTNGTAPAAWVSSVPGEGLQRTKKGFVVGLENVARGLDTTGFWKRVGFDEFRGELVVCEWDEALGEERWQPLRRHTLVGARVALEHAGFEPIGRDMMRDALELVGLKHVFDSAQLWLNRQSWDGQKRVDSFLQTYCGVADSTYARAVSRYLWSALSGRVMSPGVKADMVPIFVGGQGQKKSWGVESLAPFGDWYVTVDLAARDADIIRRMRGRLVWEIADLRGLRSRDNNSIKQFISEHVDTWVPKWEEFAAYAQRRGLFIGTANEDEILDDETGNRRWLPFDSGVVDRIAVERDRGQLWAEGAAIYAAEGVCWEEAERLGKLNHERYMVTDLWSEEIRDWLAKRDKVDTEFDAFTVRDVALGIGLDPRTVTRALEMRLGKALRGVGATKGRQRDEVGTQKRVWVIKTL